MSDDVYPPEVRAAADAMRRMYGSPTWEEYAARALEAASLFEGDSDDR